MQDPVHQCSYAVAKLGSNVYRWTGEADGSVKVQIMDPQDRLITVGCWGWQVSGQSREPTRTILTIKVVGTPLPTCLLLHAILAAEMPGIIVHDVMSSCCQSRDPDRTS